MTQQVAQEALAERTKIWAFSAEVGQALATGETMPVMLQRCCQAMVDHLEAAFARIWTVDAAGDVLELVASAGMYTHLNGPHSRVPIGTFKIGLIAKERKPHLTNAVMQDERVGDPAWARREGMIAFAGYPLVVQDELVGVMAMFSRKQLSEVVLSSMSAVANGIAVGIQRKHIEERLRESEARYRLIAESASDGIISIDSESRIHFVNDALCRMFGYTRDELLGQRLLKLMPERFHEKHLAGIRRYVTTRVRQLAWSGLELPGLRKDGVEITLEVSFGETMQHGQPMFAGILRDTTERKRAAERFHAQYNVTSILAQSNDLAAIPTAIQAICEGLGWDLGACWVADRSSGQLSYLTGWNKPSEALGDFQTSSVHRTFSKGEGLPGSVWAAGEPRWITDVEHDTNFPRSGAAQRSGLRAALAFPIRVEDTVIGVIEFFSREQLSADPDMVRTGSAICHQLGQFMGRIRAEQDRAGKTAELARSNADLEQFTGVASHDLQEPLRTITNYVQLLAARYKDKLDSDAELFMTFIVDGAKRMSALVDSLQLYSRVDSGDRPSMGPVDLDQAVREARLNMQLTIQRGLAVITQDALPTVMGDRAQLMQLFQNLIANAIKYRSERLPLIHISAEMFDGYWKIGVTDNGIGIRPEYTSTVFEVFKRLSSDAPGVGMGLAICKRIVERHGGRIWVESEPRQGSSFYFTLPRPRITGGSPASLTPASTY